MDTYVGVVVASYSLGCFFGTIASIFLGDRLGRLKSIFFGSATMLVGAILQTTAYSLPQLIAGRIICGIGNGINTSTVPVWQAECSKPHRRGVTAAFDLSLVLAGVAVAYWVDLGLSYAEPSSVAWRFPIALQLLFIIIVMAVIFLMPESPRWLIMKDRYDEAGRVLQAINDVELDHPLITNQIQAIRVTLAVAGQGKFTHIFNTGTPNNLHRTLLSYGIQVLQQLAGINVITYYAASIYQEQIHLSPLVSRILAGVTSTVYFFSAFPTYFTIERFGRRTLLMTGSAGMAISMAVMAGALSQNTTAAGLAATTFIFVYNFFFANGWNPVPWLYPSEVVPLAIRQQANAFAVSANWIFGFMIVMVSPLMFTALGWKTYIFYAAINFATVPIIYFCYPETAYRSLEEMDIIFSKSKGFLDVVKVAQAEPNHFNHRGELVQDLAIELERDLQGLPGKQTDIEVTHIEDSVGKKHSEYSSET